MKCWVQCENKRFEQTVTGCSILRIFTRSHDDFFHVVPGSSMCPALLVWGGGSQLRRVVHDFGPNEPIQSVLIQITRTRYTAPPLLLCQDDYSSYFYITGVGKSCLLLQFTDKRFQPVHDLTIGECKCSWLQCLFVC